MPADTWTFTTLASAFNIGIEILETPMGRDVLARVGRFVVAEWHRTGIYQFGGNVNQMEAYVNHYLTAVRREVPIVIVGDTGGLGIIAETRRTPRLPNSWDGNLENFKPKIAGGITFNRPLVARMTAAIEALSSAPAGSAQARRMGERYKNFQFMFATGTTHELTHLFICYLAQGDSTYAYESYTPPRVSYLNYGRAGTAGINSLGESSRWLESQLFGGSIEYYRDPQDDDGQCGIPNLLDENAVSRKITSECVRKLVEEPREFQFPFTTEDEGLTSSRRAELGVTTIGASQPAGPHDPGRLLMCAREEQLLAYDIPGNELSEIARSPRRIQAAQIVSA